MFNKLFGGKKQEQPAVDPNQVGDQLTNTLENIEMRIKHLEHNAGENRKEAVTKKKAKDDRGAIMALRKAKMLEGELGKLEGQ